MYIHTSSKSFVVGRDVPFESMTLQLIGGQSPQALVSWK